MPNALSRRSTWLAVSTVLILFVAALLPSLNRLDFFDGVEHFNLATVQEMRRNEAAGLHVNWALPELQQDARLVKPPLTAWLAALLITPADTASLSSFKAEDRAQAMSRFVFFARLPTLVCTCLLLVGVFVLARALAQDDPRVGIIAMIVCASSMLMFQQGRRATTDLQLATWVTWTNALIAIAIFQNKKRLGYIAGGIALGLASMAKGPHIALLLTVVPFALMARRIYRAHPGRTPIESAVPRPARRWPLFVGIGLALTIGLGWYGYVAASVDGIGEVWWRELTRHNAQTGRNKMPADPWYTYLWLFAVMLPWTAWLVLGAAWALWPAPRKANTSDQPEKIGATDRYRLPMQIAIALFLLPLLIFSFFSEKKERYLLPFAAPVALLVALAIVRWWDQRTPLSKATGSSPSLDRKLGWMAALLTLVGVGWLLYSAPTAPSAFLCAIAILAAGLFLSRRSLFAPAFALLIASFIAGEMKLREMNRSVGDPDNRPQQELAAEIWRRWPSATVYSTDPVTLYGQLNRPAIVLSMHLNRVISTRPKDLPQSPQAVPLVLITDSLDASPPSVPSGWNRIATIKLRRGARYVDVLDSAGTAASH